MIWERQLSGDAALTIQMVLPIQCRAVQMRAVHPALVSTWLDQSVTIPKAITVANKIVYWQFYIKYIVFGFLQDSFSGIEQGPGHMVEVGYQKGAEQAGVNLILNVMSIPGTASEQMF